MSDINVVNWDERRGFHVEDKGLRKGPGMGANSMFFSRNCKVGEAENKGGAGGWTKGAQAGVWYRVRFSRQGWDPVGVTGALSCLTITEAPRRRW